MAYSFYTPSGVTLFGTLLLGRVLLPAPMMQPYTPAGQAELLTCDQDAYE